jgi:hypothetical protein
MMTRASFPILSLLIACQGLAACGAADEHVDDGRPDAPASDGDPDRVAAVAGDFAETGVLSTIGAPSLEVVQGVVDGVALADPAARRVGGELIIVNRFLGDNLTILDARTLTLVDQIGTGAGSNPQDVVAVGTKLYVAALGLGELLVFDRAAGNARTTIDLSDLDPDGVPDCTALRVVGGRLYVTCGLLENFRAVRPGKLVVVETATDTVATTVDLPFGNPTGPLTEVAGALYVATVPDYQDYDEGCLVRITPGPSPSAACAITNQAIDGFLSRLAPRGDVVWGIHSAFDASFDAAGALVRVNLTDGSVSAPVTPASVLAQDLAVCGQHLFLADKATGAQGIRVFHVEGTAVSERTEDALDIGLPPAFGGGLACLPPAP